MITHSQIMSHTGQIPLKAKRHGLVKGQSENRRIFGEHSRIFANILNIREYFREYANIRECSNIREYSDSPNPRGCRIWIHLIQEATGLVH